ncbi:MAG TPA: Ig-like domain-containing protein [Nocardioides sp.]|nr:Ig-like domain-containing protein [Nocardioides sp.]
MKAGKRAKVTVKVTASGVPAPLGVVKVYAGKKLVGTVKLTASAGGVATVRLAKLALGSHKLKAKFVPGTGVAASSSKVVTLKVVR